ncbi:thioesterase family protein [Sulfuracidifex tepidarius]|nr:thioesterase family protein [Sulfuracidifex tepidarius]
MKSRVPYITCKRELTTMINTGVSARKEFQVQSSDSASSVASGAVNVLSTPSVISFIENVSFHLVQNTLEEGSTTVGFHIDVYHLSPVPIGEKVEVISTVDSVNGRKIRFKAEVYWKGKKIAEGIHERVIVNEKEFYKRIEK